MAQYGIHSSPSAVTITSCLLGKTGRTPGIEYHHIVEQVQEEVSEFSSNAINSTANVVPTPAAVHAEISAFYSTAQTWLDGETVRDWMSTQTFDVQWQEGLEIWKQAMTGDITWRPPSL